MMKRLRIILSLFLPLTLFPLLLIHVHAATGPTEAYVSGWIPNFGHEYWVKAPHSIVASSRDGNWSDPGTWSPAQIPNVNSVVQIRHHVVFDASSAEAAAVVIYPPDAVNTGGGKLSFHPDINTSLRLVHFLVHKDGVLEIGTEETPIKPQVKANIIFRDRPINTNDLTQSFFDPAQHGNGLLAFGKVMIHGSPKTPTFVRTSAEPLRGQSSLSFTQSVSGWQTGDRLVLPDTRHLLKGGGEIWWDYVPQWETFNIQSVGGTSVSIDKSLAFNHIGPRDGDGTPTVLPNGEKLMPHVGNLSRNVIFRSETLAETGKAAFCRGGDKLTNAGVCVTRGHTLFTGRAEVDIFYAEFRDLGRTVNIEISSTSLDSVGNPTQIGTNVDGRHAVYASHLIGPNPSTDPNYQYKFVGNAIVDSYKWPMTISDSHYGLIKDNVIFNGTGAGLVTRNGNESLNMFDHNFVVYTVGDKSHRDNNGRDGTNFWFRGFNHLVRNNVASTANNRSQANGAGFEFVWPAASKVETHIPAFRGGDPWVNGEYRLVDMQLIPIQEFVNNEAYGAMSVGMMIWHLGTDGYFTRDIQETVIKNFTVWHGFEGAYFSYPMQNVTFDGFTVRGHPRALVVHNFGTGFTCGDYWCGNITIRNSDIQGYGSGIGAPVNTPGIFTIENSYFRNHGSNIVMQTLATPGTGAYKPPRKTIVRNVKFDPWPGRSLSTVSMYFSTELGKSNYIQNDEMYVFSHNQVPSDNFRLYYKAQHPNFIVPQTTYYGGDNNGDGREDFVYDIGSPETGLTNQQNWDKYFPNGTLKTDPNAQGLAIAGAVAPCPQTDVVGTCSNALVKSEAGGFAFPIIDDATPPTVPQNLTATPKSQSQIDLSWNAASDPESGVSHYKVYRDGNFLRQTTALSLSDTGRSEAVTYSYQVSAVNIASLESAKSPAVSATTLTDRTPPQISTVRSPPSGTRVSVLFSEPVEEASSEIPANYNIDPGVTIQSATLEIDLKTVTLITTRLSEGISYTLTVNNVKDRARTPNTIAPNSTGSFTFSASGPMNSSPSINAGPDKIVALAAGAQLDGSATDDGLPTPPTLTILWSQVGGPGVATIENPGLLDTKAHFSSEGVYVFRLTVFDGELTSTDEIAITVTLSGSSQTEIPKFKNIINPAKGELITVPMAGEAVIEIYTRSGELLKQLRSDGYAVQWDGRDEKGKIVSSGVYLWKIKLGNKTETRKVVVLK